VFVWGPGLLAVFIAAAEALLRELAPSEFTKKKNNKTNDKKK
jgi:hypothetical protein